MLAGYTRVHILSRNGAVLHALKLVPFVFARNRNIALFRDTIYQRVWEAEFDGDSRTVDLHVQRLRKKLGWQHRLTAIYKVGYRLEDPK